MWSLKNLVHSPATRKHVQQGTRGLEDVSLGKEGGGGTWPQKGRGKDRYYIMEFLNDPLLIEGKKVSTLAL